MNVICCDKTRKVFSQNFYHFIFHQLYDIYTYWHSVQCIPLILYYNGPYKEVVQEIPFLTLIESDDLPQKCIEIQPKCNADNATSLRFSKYLKCNILPKININYTDKISIVQRSKNRIIQNLDLLQKQLNTVGTVEVIVLEDHNFLKQIELLHSSRYVIMPHGAGLTHLLFANSLHTTFIEIYPKYFKWRNYEGIAKKLNVPFKVTESILDLHNFYQDKDLEFILSKKNKEGTFDREDIIKPINHKLRKYVRDVKYVEFNIDELLTFIK